MLSDQLCVVRLFPFCPCAHIFEAVPCSLRLRDLPLLTLGTCVASICYGVVMKSSRNKHWCLVS